MPTLAFQFHLDTCETHQVSESHKTWNHNVGNKIDALTGGESVQKAKSAGLPLKSLATL